MSKIIIIGPSVTNSKGGMAEVISEIKNDPVLREQHNLYFYESFRDAGLLRRIIFSAFSLLRFYMTGGNYDIYHIHMASYGSTFRKGYYVYAAKRWGKKVILHIHGAGFIEFYNHLGKKKQEKVAKILHSADLVIVLSEKWKHDIEELFQLKECVALPNGVVPDKFTDAINNPQLYRNSFLMLGRLGKRKGTYDLIDAMEIAVKKKPELRLYLAGDGDISQIEKMILHRGLRNNVIVVGWVDYDEKIELLKKTATFVLPSYKEGMPMAILEAMAAGKAIISTEVGSIPEVVQRENGRLIQPGDIDALANTMIEFSENVDMIKEMSLCNISKIRKSFSVREMHQKLADFYEYVGRNI